MRNVRSAVVVSCIVGTLFVTPAWSQTVAGVVTDSAGHPIPGAEARLASMDAQTVAAVVATANGTFTVTAPRPKSRLRRYYAELCAPGFAPQVEVVPMAPGDTLVVRGGLTKARRRNIPVGTGACAWESDGATMSVTGGRGFGITAIETAHTADSINSSYPRDPAARARMLHADEAAWLHMMSIARDANARERAAWVLAQLIQFDEKPDATMLAQIRRALPPSSRWWQVGSSLLLLQPAEMLFGVEIRDTSAATLARRRAARDYIVRIKSARYDPDMDADVQSELALYDLSMRDTAAVTRRAKALIADHPGYIGAKLAMFRYRWLTPIRDGAPMPRFDFATLPGAPQPRLTNRDLSAPYTLLVFWGTWCAHCIEELPALDSLNAEYHKRGLDIVSIAANDSPEVTSAFVRTHDMPWRQAYAGTTEDPFLQRIGVLLYPTSVLVDSTGTILTSSTMTSTPRAMVERFLNR